VFADRENGFYLDVGAGHPIADNVSFWFYLKGWRGLVVEPQRKLADLYRHLRARDITVCGLVGRYDGEMDFHIVDRLHGLSSTRESHAEAAANLGTTFATIKMPVQTLASLCAAHSIKDVDFLKVDVEGAEADVLAGADWMVFRPRVVVVEAAAPGGSPEAWREWEPLLLTHDYRFAFFDGLNRFYVAGEAAALAARFPAEPAPWDRVQHLWDFGRAPERPDHPDHALARCLVDGFLAALPSLDPALIHRLIMAAAGSTPSRSETAATIAALLFGSAEFPGVSPHVQPSIDGAPLYRALIDTDRFRAALGRIAASYDGGHLMD
jgi:FkbM family methyltransferase